MNFKNNSNNSLDIDNLINVSIEIGNLIQGQKISDDAKTTHFAEGLGQKIITHTLTARYLFDGYQFSNINGVYAPNIDYSSIIILTRAAFETYLTLNYVFIAEQNESLKKFRFLCWDLAGFLERAKFIATQEEHKKLKEDEARTIIILTEHLKENPIFKGLPPRIQKLALRGEWKLNYKWHDLATKAGFNIDYFRQHYKFLCGHAHASRLSVIQIQQNKSIEQQRNMAIASMTTLTVVLAKYMYDYIDIMPQLKNAKDDTSKYQIINFWKNVGEKL